MPKLEKDLLQNNTINESFKINTIIDSYNSSQIMKEY